MFFKPIRQVWQSGNQMIVTDCLPGSFPDLLLRVQVRRSRWKVNHFQTWMSCQEVSPVLTLMPTGSIPEQYDRSVRIGFQQLLHVCCRTLTGQLSGAQGNHSSTMQIEGGKEVHLLPIGVGSHQRGLTPRRPDGHGSGLQVKCSFIPCQKEGIWSILGEVNHFFFRVVLQIPSPFALYGTGKPWRCVDN